MSKQTRVGRIAELEARAEKAERELAEWKIEAEELGANSLRHLQGKKQAERERDEARAKLSREDMDDWIAAGAMDGLL